MGDGRVFDYGWPVIAFAKRFIMSEFAAKRPFGTGGAAGVASPAVDEDAIQSLRGPIRLRTLTVLRWLAVAGQTTAIGLVHFGFGFPIALGMCIAIIALSVWLNVFSMLRFSSQRYLSDGEAALFIGFDIVQLCALLAVTGGLTNPFAVLIIAPVTIAASILSIRRTLAIGVLAIAGASLLSVFHLPLPWRAGEAVQLPVTYLFGVWTALSIAVAFFAVYARRIAGEASQMRSALAATQIVLAREERLAALGGLAAAAAHELGTPLATIQVTAKEMLGELRGHGPLEEDAQLIVSQAQRCRDILGRLSNRGEQTDAMLERIGADILLREAAAPFAEPGREPAVIFEVAAGSAEPAPVLARRPEIIYGLRNFIENAVGFASSKVLVKAGWTADTFTVSVHDDGPGFATEVLARLGEPYVSMRSREAAGRRSGLGLGFFIAKTLIERTGGAVVVANQPWEDGSTGAWVSVSWPRDAIETRPMGGLKAGAAAAF